jgi:N-acetylglucosaminyldiphosphoundecaprenol N-acetyl-beta-D-mannosaminyltransferase
MKKKQLISLNVNLISYQDALAKVIDLSRQHIPSYVCFANSHMCIEAHWDNQFAAYVNNGVLTVTDGTPLVIALRLLYCRRQDRIAGMDFMPSIIQACERENLSIFLFGSTPQVLQSLSEKIKERHPQLKIAGSISPAFRAFTPEEAGSYVTEINNSKANVVLVGMGCPKQETWMAQYSQSINATLLGVGGAFSVFGGLTKRAPVWMQKTALEWLYRLIQEPKRMWKRYLVTNTLFICLLIKEIFLTRIGILKK